MRPFEQLTIEQVAHYPLPGTTVPGSVRFTPDGRAVCYLFSADGSLVRSLWRYDLVSGERTVLAGPPGASADEATLSREEVLRRERARLRELGVTAYEFAPRAAATVLLVPAGGKLLASVGGSPLEEIPGCDGAIDPHLSPDGRRVAFVRAGELWVADVPGGDPRQLTSGAEDGLTNGLAEFLAQEELDRARGFWWSPDGERIAFEQADERHIPVFPIVHQGLDAVDVEPHRYPFAGAANARVRLGAVTIASGAVEWLDLGPDDDIYLARVHWRPDGVPAAEILDRAQQEVTLVAFEPGGRRTLIRERTQPWLNLAHDTRFLESGEILWSSERTGYRHLYLYGAGGQPRALTGGEWVVTRVVHVDERERHAYFMATRDGPAERHLYRAALDGGEMERLTDGAGWHDATFAADASAFIDTFSNRKTAPRITVHPLSAAAAMPTADGRQPELPSPGLVLFDNADLSADALGLSPPQLVSLPAADGTPLLGLLYRPAGSAAGLRPIAVSVYGGPHAQRCVDSWGATIDLRAQYLAQHGFFVLKVDNRGSANRGLAFEAPIHLAMGTVEADDQAAAVTWLAGHEPADINRVGIYGWSYGGYMTLMCMVRRPDLFRAGVAGAPVTHWDGYDTGYTERYMSTPEKNPDGYREGAVMTHADALAGKLLIVHGMIDENVHFRHTARLMVALGKAQKEYELLAYPEERHMPRDAHGLEYQERRVLAFLEAHV